MFSESENVNRDLLKIIVDGLEQENQYCNSLHCLGLSVP
jgi:hypothetical protein